MEICSNKKLNIFQWRNIMDFIDRIRELSVRIPKQLEHISTEQATKNALVLPFIQALGYNIFDPTEVLPEFIADIGVKKGEKVDYAIMHKGKPVMLFECKHVSVDLDNAHMSQLFRYFTVTEARIGVLTNGVEYRFFSDLEAPNKMDERPFLVFSMLNIQENLVNELKKLAKDGFDLDEMLSRASDLKYTREIKRILDKELNAPSARFVKFFASQVYSGNVTQNVVQIFTDIVQRAHNQFINEKINERLQSAITDNQPTKQPELPEPVEVEEETRADRIETTDEEMEGFYMVKGILHGIVDPKRIAHRDLLSYFNILLDDNNRKPICRLHFNNPDNKQISLFDENKKERRITIDRLDDIYKYADDLKQTIGYYDND